MLENSEILQIREKRHKMNKIFRTFEKKKIRQLKIRKKENSKIRNFKTFTKTDYVRHDNGI